jgi:hypothetical protein
MRGGNIIFRHCPEADWSVNIGFPESDFATRIPLERRILFLMEPPVVETYDLSFLSQFGILVSPYHVDGYTGRMIYNNPCLGWFAGKAGWDGANPVRFGKLSDVESYTVPDKNKPISVISSLKKKKPGHRRRVAFISELMSRYGNGIDYYGVGFAPVPDKMDAIAPYKYHIAIENCNLNNYWTEKLTDAWIGWSLPIYCGDPSILRQVPDPMGIEVIDIGDPMSAMRHIDYILGEDIYSSRLDAIAACRKWAIKKSNMLEMVCGIIESSERAVLKKPKLETDEVIRRIGRPSSSAGEIIRGAFSWCAGKYFAWNIKRAYRKINREKSAIGNK